MVRKTLSNLATFFRDHNKPDPMKNGGNGIQPFVSSIIKLFKKCDLKEKSQKVITPNLLIHIYTRKNNNFSRYTADLYNGAFFFIR